MEHFGAVFCGTHKARSVFREAAKWHQCSGEWGQWSISGGCSVAHVHMYTPGQYSGRLKSDLNAHGTVEEFSGDSVTTRLSDRSAFREAEKWLRYIEAQRLLCTVYIAHCCANEDDV